MTETTDPQQQYFQTYNTPRPTEYLEHLDTQKYLEKIEHNLKGEKYDFKKQNWVKVPELAIMNERGVDNVLRFLGSILDKQMFLSNLHPKEIEKVCRALHIALARDFLYHWRVYDLEKGLRGDMVAFIMKPIYIGLKHAEGEGDRSLMRDITSFQNTGNAAPQENRNPRML